MTPAELRALLDERPRLLDGGLGSLLISAGLEAGRAPEHWNLEHPERVEAAHRAYVEAGSDLIHTNTFGANRLRLAAGGLDNDIREINRAAVTAARRASAGKALIAGDIGPVGVALPPVGSASIDEIRAAFDEQVAILVEGGVDLLSIETMSDLREAVAAAEAACAAGVAVIASMTFEVRRRGAFTVMGNPLVPSLRSLAAAGATVVGCNCSVTAAEMRALAAEAAPALGVPLAMQPNAGKPRMTEAGIVYDADADAFAAELMEMIAAGARLVGGCCGTTPAFIAATRALLDGMSQ